MIYNAESCASVKEAGRGGYLGDGEEAACERYFASRWSLLIASQVSVRRVFLANARSMGTPTRHPRRSDPRIALNLGIISLYPVVTRSLRKAPSREPG